MESVATLRRNQWQGKRGMGGRIHRTGHTRQEERVASAMGLYRLCMVRPVISNDPG